jgi:hypothetical protein
MSSSFRFSKDHTGFYRDNEPFSPKIQSGEEASNVVVLKLPASLQHDLDWSLEKKRAEEIGKSGKAILWEIDFAWDASAFRSSAAFFAYGRALEEFSKMCSGFAEHTFGVCLYRGSADFPLFDFAHWEDLFNEWLEEIIQGGFSGHELKQISAQEIETVRHHYFHLYKADLFASYLQRLVSFLPDTLLSFAFFDAATILSPAFRAQLFSKHRFEHLHLGFEKEQTERMPLAPLALCLPSDAYCDRKILARLDVVMHDLKAKDVQFRIISEEKLTEEWEGLDQLIVIKESISPLAKRKLLGFAAAGGEIIEN